ncbi:MAG: hypothetical protein AAF772_09410 [Acidobacteriota bacterium]
MPGAAPPAPSPARRIAAALLLGALALAPGSAARADADDVPVFGPGTTVPLPTALEAARDRLLYGFDRGALAPLPAGDLRAPDAPGMHWLLLIERLDDGTLGPPTWQPLLVDGTPPTIELVIDPPPIDARWIPRGTEVRLTADDDLTAVRGVHLTRNEGNAVSDAGAVNDTAMTRRATMRLITGGPVTVNAWSIDRVGNRTAEQSVALEVDSAPPEIHLAPGGDFLRAADDALVLGPGGRIDVCSARDAATGVASWWTGVDAAPPGDALEPAPPFAGETAGEPPKQTDALDGPWTTSGAYTAVVAVRDRVGQRGVARLPFTVDADGPTVTWSLDGRSVVADDGSTIWAAPITLHAAAEDAPAGLASLVAAGATLVGAPEDKNDDPPRLTDVDRAEIVAVDALGNRTVVEAAWRRDAEAPIATLTRADDDAALPADATVRVAVGDALTLRVADDGAGVAAASYDLGGILRGWDRGELRADAPRTLPFAIRGRYRLRVATRDRLDNRSVASWTIVVERAGAASGGTP